MSAPAPPEFRPEDYQTYLRALARRHVRISRKLQARFGESDVIQDTLANAHKGRAQFRGTTEAEFVRWLKSILHHTFLDRIRAEKAQACDPDVQQSLAQMCARSSALLEDFLVDRGPSPSVDVERQEVLRRFAAALEALPWPQWRDAVIFRDLHGMPVKDIAVMMGKSEKAVAGYLRMGRKELRKSFPEYAGEGVGEGDEDA